MSILLSEPHEYWRWRNHKPTYADFKKEMWANSEIRVRVFASPMLFCRMPRFPAIGLNHWRVLSDAL